MHFGNTKTDQINSYNNCFLNFCLEIDLQHILSTILFNNKFITVVIIIVTIGAVVLFIKIKIMSKIWKIAIRLLLIVSFFNIQNCNCISLTKNNFPSNFTNQQYFYSNNSTTKLDSALKIDYKSKNFNKKISFFSNLNKFSYYYYIQIFPNYSFKKMYYDLTPSEQSMDYESSTDLLDHIMCIRGIQQYSYYDLVKRWENDDLKKKDSQYISGLGLKAHVFYPISEKICVKYSELSDKYANSHIYHGKYTVKSWFNLDDSSINQLPLLCCFKGTEKEKYFPLKFFEVISGVPEFDRLREDYDVFGSSMLEFEKQDEEIKKKAEKENLSQASALNELKDSPEYIVETPNSNNISGETNPAIENNGNYEDNSNTNFNRNLNQTLDELFYNIEKEEKEKKSKEKTTYLNINMSHNQFLLSTNDQLTVEYDDTAKSTKIKIKTYTKKE